MYWIRLFRLVLVSDFVERMQVAQLSDLYIYRKVCLVMFDVGWTSLVRCNI